MFLVGREFRAPVSGISLQSISDVMRIPSITLAPIATALEANGLLTTSEKEQLQPGREMARILLSDVLAVVRRDGETGSHRDPRWDDVIEKLGKSLDGAVADILSDKTIADLLNESEHMA